MMQMHPAADESAGRVKKNVRWAFLQKFRVEKAGEPFLFRLRVLQTPWFSVLIHHIQQDDLDRAPHDHPWPFASLILRGGYHELIWDEPSQLSESRSRTRKPGSFARIKLDQAHQITELRGDVWTLAFTGRHHGTWRFWTKEGPIDWRNYEAAQPLQE